MKSFKNLVVTGSRNRPMATDIFFEPDGKPKPVLIYVHGFNGFKDWANFDIIAGQFAEAGFVFVKFNFSHNGTTHDYPYDFIDLEAFGKNNYSIQLDDLGYILDWVCGNGNPFFKEIDQTRIYLIGHSMGGGISVIKAAEDERIKKLVTWASICACKTPWSNWTHDKLDEWKREGVAYYKNSRTNQEMPLYYQLYEDYLSHEDRLSIRKAISRLNIPILICHGNQDASVPVQSAHLLKKWQPAASLFLVESDHVFGRKHPWTKPSLPIPMGNVVFESIKFLVSCQEG